MGPTNSHRISRVPWYSGIIFEENSYFHLRGYHPLWPDFPVSSVSMNLCNSPEDLQLFPIHSYYPRVTTPARFNVITGLGSSPFARHYLGNRGFFLFLRILRCFNSPGLATYTYEFCACRQRFTLPGCPIRSSTDQ